MKNEINLSFCSCYCKIYLLHVFRMVLILFERIYLSNSTKNILLHVSQHGHFMKNIVGEVRIG